MMISAESAGTSSPVRMRDESAQVVEVARDAVVETSAFDRALQMMRAGEDVDAVLARAASNLSRWRGRADESPVSWPDDEV